MHWPPCSALQRPRTPHLGALTVPSKNNPPPGVCRAHTLTASGHCSDGVRAERSPPAPPGKATATRPPGPTPLTQTTSLLAFHSHLTHYVLRVAVFLPPPVHEGRARRTLFHHGSPAPGRRPGHGCTRPLPAQLAVAVTELLEQLLAVPLLLAHLLLQPVLLSLHTGKLLLEVLKVRSLPGEGLS